MNEQQRRGGRTATTDGAFYARWPDRVASARSRLGRPLTLAEKVLQGHLATGPDVVTAERRQYVDLRPDRVALQDALAQMVALQFMTAGLHEVAIPTTVHCDHLVTARAGAESDIGAALGANAEVYDFLRSFCARFGLQFWEPGSGIIHQVVLEHHAFPGGLLIGTDSHTPNAGGLGMMAVGVGGGDAIDAMTGACFNLAWPRLIGVRLTGSLSGWAAPKDVILAVAAMLTTSGGTGAMLEYFGPGAATISATGRATICNMGAEVGATTSIFPYDGGTGAFLRATCRSAVAERADAAAADLRADPEVEREPERFFDEVMEVDLSALGPLVNGPDRPDLSHGAAEVGDWARRHGVPTAVSAALVGSCTNSSYEDIARAAAVARSAAAAGLRVRAPLLITPGSEQIRATVERDGLLGDLLDIGGTVLANACGPCIGQWDRPPDHPDTNTIVTSYNRNFPRRNDGRADTRAFVASPQMVVAYALAGRLDFDPRSDALTADDGAEVRLPVPVGPTLPPDGFERPAPPGAGPIGAPVLVAPGSERLQLLEPFDEWDGRDYLALPVLVKATGRCTTDHISAAGPWLAYRGHLKNISGNLFLGAVNAYSGRSGEGKDPLDGRTRPFPVVAEHLAEEGVRWCAVGDLNYGEGSSREHAAMEPRYRGCVAVLARSFARIHETNLKKQGVLPLTFTDAATYDEIGEDDRVGIHGLAQLIPGLPVRCSLTRPDGSRVTFWCTHTFSPAQIGWFRAGSALNVIRAKGAPAR